MKEKGCSPRRCRRRTVMRFYPQSTNQEKGSKVKKKQHCVCRCEPKRVPRARRWWELLEAAAEAVIAEEVLKLVVQEVLQQALYCLGNPLSTNPMTIWIPLAVRLLWPIIRICIAAIRRKWRDRAVRKRGGRR